MHSRHTLPSLCVALLVLPVGAHAQLLDRNSIDRECDRCSDLCALVDQYWQKAPSNRNGAPLTSAKAAPTPRSSCSPGRSIARC